MSLHFVTGKGGVGKSSYCRFLKKKDPSYHVYSVTELSAADTSIYTSIDKTKLYEKFITSTIKIPFVMSLISKSTLFHTLLQLAPNLYELLILELFFEESKKKNILVDAPSTGHFISLLNCIQTALEVFDGGKMRKIAEQIANSMKNTDWSVTILSLPEQSSLSEMSQLQENLTKHYPFAKQRIVLNRSHHYHQSSATNDFGSQELLDLYNQRIQLEDKRTKPYSWNEVFLEGGL